MVETKYLKQLYTEIGQRGSWSNEEIRGRVMSKIEKAGKEEEENKRVVDKVEIYDFFAVKLHGIPHPCVIFARDEGCVWGMVDYHNNMCSR